MSELVKFVCYVSCWIPMNDIIVIFAFQRYCLGCKVDMGRVVACMNWQLLFSFTSKQALLGLCFDGIERLGKE